MKRFLYYYLRSMRLYYCFVTGSATLTGIALARAAEPEWRWTDFLLLGIGFLAWGVNQIFNDYGNLAEDRINAPRRPMVTGTLAARPALMLSAALMLLFALLSLCISPWTLLPVLAGGILNLIYNRAKKIPVIGNLVYGASIFMCTLYGFAGAGGTVWRASGLAAFLIASHALMCLYSTLKDIDGDRAAGLRTLAVSLGFKATQTVAEYGTLLLLVSVLFLPETVSLPLEISLGWCAILAGWNAFCFAERKLHRATLANCQSCTAQQLLILCALWGTAGLAVQAVSWIAIQLLFRWYRDEKE